MRNFALTFISLAYIAVGQNCGPKYGNQVCAADACCSQYGWCDTGAGYCDPSTCLSYFSGKDSPCAASSPSSTLKTSTTTRPTSTPFQFPSSIPVIDVCGHAQGGVTCPGAGPGGYFYRCCSSAGHCGPKNELQDEAIYCGAGCQAGFGVCDSQSKPAPPTAQGGEAGEGETCGPIVNKKCGGILCCSGSNFCGKGTDFCGAENWCQDKWGKCD